MNWIMDFLLNRNPSPAKGYLAFLLLFTLEMLVFGALAWVAMKLFEDRMHRL